MSALPTPPTLMAAVDQARRKEFYDEGTWWDENGEAGWFDADKWSAWEAVAGFAYYLSEGDLQFGATIELTRRVTMVPWHIANGYDEPDVDGRMSVVSDEDAHPDDAVEAWEVRAR